MFAGWVNFYLMVGQAAATLIGLLFVIVTLGAALGARFRRMADVFVTPTLVHFAAVFVIAMMVLIPDGFRTLALLCLLVGGLSGLAYVIALGGRVFSSGVLEPSDYWARLAFVPLPALAYLLIVAGSVMALAGRPESILCLGAAATILLVVGIRNAWAMALFAVVTGTRETDKKKPT